MKKFPLLKSNMLFNSKEEEYEIIKNLHEVLQKALIPLKFRRVKLPDSPGNIYKNIR